MANPHNPNVYPSNDAASGVNKMRTVSVGDSVRVRHVSLGEFVGRVVGKTAGVTEFVIVDGNQQLADADYKVGDSIEFGNFFFRIGDL